jgi:hypothetical protein
MNNRLVIFADRQQCEPMRLVSAAHVRSRLNKSESCGGSRGTTFQQCPPQRLRVLDGAKSKVIISLLYCKAFFEYVCLPQKVRGGS